MPVSLRTEKPPRSAVLQPSGQELELHYEDGYASTRVTVSDGHAMVVFAQ
jgi:hypothetical protein